MTMAILALVAGTTWWWQIDGIPPKNVKEQVIDLDLFDVPKDDIKSYSQKIICYFSGGSYESWRPDASKIPKSARGKKMDGWDEQWLNVRDKGVRDVMKSRLDLAKSKGCAGVEVDNVDGYGNSTGFNITKKDSIDFLTFLSTEAHSRGLAIGLKNSPDIVDQLVTKFDFAVVEECARYSECDKYTPFIKANKAVFQAEYRKYSQSVCDAAKRRKFSLTFFTQGTSLNGNGLVQCK